MKAAHAALKQMTTGRAPGGNAASRGRAAAGGGGTDPAAAPPAAQPPAAAGSHVVDTVAASLEALAKEGNSSSDELRTRLRGLLASLGVEGTFDWAVCIILILLFITQLEPNV